MKSPAIGLLGALALLGTSSAAHAAVYQITYQGVVDPSQAKAASDIDVALLFGGGNLSGKAVKAVFTYDTALGTRTQGATSDELTGGGAFGNVSPFTSAVFTINGFTYNFTPDYYGDAQTQSGSGAFVQEQATSTMGDNAYVAFLASNAPASLTTAFSDSLAADATAGSYFDPGATNTGLYDDIAFDTFSVSVAPFAPPPPVGGVPEPSTWGLMALAVAGMGVALRRRRSPASAFA